MLTMRPATLDDVPILREWDSRPHIIAIMGDDDLSDWESELACATQWQEPPWKWDFIAEVDNKPIDMVQIIDPHRETDHYWGDVAENLRAIDIWIGEVEYLGQGHGSVMMATALEFCYSDPDVTGVLIDPLASNARARKFYEQMGFEFVEYRTFGTDYCAVYQHTR